MIKITQASPEVLNNKFRRFTRMTLNGQNRDATYLVSQMKQYEKSYKKLGMLDVFSESAARLAEGLHHRGLDDFAGIIYSNLVKLPNISPKQREVFAQKALEVAQKQGEIFGSFTRLL